MKQDFVIINGRAYSPVTGLPVEEVATTSAEHVAPIQVQTHKTVKQRGTAVGSLHKANTQHATTLNRRHVKQPQAKPLASRVKKTSHSIDTPQHVAVRRFSTKPVAQPVTSSTARTIDRPAEQHPVVRRAAAQPIAVKQPRAQRLAQTQAVTSQTPLQKQSTNLALKPASVLKNEAISEALAREIAPQPSRRQKKQRRSVGRWVSLASTGVAVMLLGGYFTYLSMPNISVRVAAVQSGIDAKYPGYAPNGYSLRGPIAFKDGEVTMKFAYVGSDLQYTVRQEKSSWDSSAVKEYITEKSGTAPATTTVDGLTLYTSGAETSWVNGGILYRIEGDAVLSGEQIRKIATSM